MLGVATRRAIGSNPGMSGRRGVTVFVVMGATPLGLTYPDPIRGNASTAGGAATGGAHPLTSESVVKAVGV